MGKKEKFIEMVDSLISANSQVALDSDAMAFYEAFKVSNEKSKPQFTDNGKLILQYMKDNEVAKNNLFKAKEIAEGIFITSRSVSGSMRKLVTDGFIEKSAGGDVTLYSITEAGRVVEIV